MPHIVIYSPRMTREVKVACAEAVTRAFAETTKLGSEYLTIHFEEHSYDNVAVGGRLLTDAIPELAAREAAWQQEQKR